MLSPIKIAGIVFAVLVLIVIVAIAIPKPAPPPPQTPVIPVPPAGSTPPPGTGTGTSTGTGRVFSVGSMTPVTTTTWRADMRCGSNYGGAKCKPGYCCSKYGWCGAPGSIHCTAGTNWATYNGTGAVVIQPA